MGRIKSNIDASNVSVLLPQQGIVVFGRLDRIALSFSIHSFCVLRFAGASSFNQGLCPWGSQLRNGTVSNQLRNDVNLAGMFAETSCQYTESPSSPGGRWCRDECVRRGLR